MSAVTKAAMIPRRLRVWLLAWTPILWLLLELTMYPHDVYVSDGLAAVVGGFLSPRVASYPASVLLLGGAAVLAAAVSVALRDVRTRTLGLVLGILGGLVLAWGVAAGFNGDAFSLSNRSGSHGWFWQTVAVLLIPVCVVAWARARPERAGLLVKKTHQTWRLFRENRAGLLGLAIMTTYLAIALLAPFLAAHSYLDPNAQVAAPFSGPAWSYYRILGADEQGLSIYAEFVWSSRISLAVGLLATLISSLLGAAIGIGAGFYGGWRAEVGMRTTDIFLVLPWLPLAMILAAAWGRNYGMIILIIGITSWPGTARIVRAETMKVRRLQYIERADAIGAANFHTMMKHILPNVFPLIFANTVLVVAIAILAETTLSFLGLGDPLNFSWGTMLRNAWLSGAAGIPQWAYLIAPGASIILVVLAFTFVGQALDTVLDPKLRRRDGKRARRGRMDAALAVAEGTPEEATPVAEMGGMVVPEDPEFGSGPKPRGRRAPGRRKEP